MNIPSFETLVERHSAELYAYLYRLTRQEGDAQDCLQEVYLKAYRAYHRLPADANARAWLYRIATNTAFSHLRRRKREAGWQAEADERDATDAPQLEDQAGRRALISAVAAAVEKLPAQQRAALVLKQYQALSYAEVAETLACTEAAARANVYQALKKLRKEFRHAAAEI